MKKLPLILSALLAIPALIIIWSFIEPYLIDTESQVGEIPNLPPAWEGQRVAQLSDFQVGLWGDNRGQVRLPFTPDWSWLTFAREDTIHADGWIDEYGEPGNQLYVNRGIGMSELPIRFNCIPELTFFTLESS